MTTIKGIKKAVSFINGQCVFSRIYLNTKTNKVVAFQYANANSSTIFQDPYIKEIGKWSSRDGKISMEDIKEMIQSSKSVEQRVLESYFDEEVTEIRIPEYKVNGKWYQVLPVSFLDTEEEKGELEFVKECPTYEYEGIDYYIIEQ